MDACEARVAVNDREGSAGCRTNRRVQWLLFRTAMTSNPQIYQFEPDVQSSRSVRTPNKREPGFTLLELVLVVAIIGLMSTIASPSFFSMRERARYANCVLKQRQIHEAGILYSAETNPGTVDIRVTVLTGADTITRSASWPTRSTRSPAT